MYRIEVSSTLFCSMLQTESVVIFRQEDALENDDIAVRDLFSKWSQLFLEYSDPEILMFHNEHKEHYTEHWSGCPDQYFSSNKSTDCGEHKTNVITVSEALTAEILLRTNITSWGNDMLHR